MKKLIVRIWNWFRRKRQPEVVEMPKVRRSSVRTPTKRAFKGIAGAR